MSEWVTNASPLIFLAKLDRLDLLRKSAQSILVPSAVIDEIAVYDDTASRQINASLDTWLHRRNRSSHDRLMLLQQEIGAGEAAAITLGLETNAERVVLDDLDGRRWARRLGLRPVGTLGILLAARLRGEIPSVEVEIRKLLAQGFRAGDSLVAAILKEAGE